ncbi:hypothetical protein V497_03903, partial [Pseudogymnoascus sp. VKM F-4516 (FW-969)]
LLPTLLLPALDLLDRALLTRVTATLPPPLHLPEPSTTSATGPSTAAPAAPAAAPSGATHRNQIYLVRSSQATRARGMVGERVYIVRLGAWNCTCAAFAFSAFPGAASSLVFEAGTEEEEEDEVDCGETGEKWQFGGVSRDGIGGGVPCWVYWVSAYSNPAAAPGYNYKLSKWQNISSAGPPTSHRPSKMQQ